MTKPRGPLDYLSDSWGLSNDANVSDANLPYCTDDPPSPEFSPQQGVPGYGHSDDVKVTDGAKWNMDRSEVAAGFERPKSDGEGGVLETRQPGGSFPQSIPDSNPHDRGAGSDVRSREFAEEGRDFNGRGHAPSGHKIVGSRENLG
jgi:hypothetical protein